MDVQFTIDTEHLRSAIKDEFAEVAACPLKGFHFHTGRFLANRLGYPPERVDHLPDSAVESFAGVGNPFTWGDPASGETVLDLGSGPASIRFWRPSRSGRTAASSGSI